MTGSPRTLRAPSTSELAIEADGASGLLVVC
jgi:hypothetical protein